MNFIAVLVISISNIIHTVSGQYEGVCFKKSTDSSNKNLFPVFPKEVKINSSNNLQVREWAVNANEQVKCACPDSNDLLTRTLVEAGDCPCQCPHPVQYQIHSQTHSGYVSYAVGFQIRYNLIDRGEELRFVASMQAFVFDDASYFILSRQSKLLRPQPKEIDLEIFEQASFDGVEKLAPFYDRIEQERYFTRETQNNGEFYLIPQQLVREDHTMNVWKPSTHYNFNVVLVWNVIVDEWNKIQDEILTRHNQGTINHQMDVVSGTSGAYMYRDENGDDKQLLLKSSKQPNQQIIVPYYHWKLYTMVDDHSKSQSIFLIMHNDPNKDSPQQQKICSISVCENHSSLKDIVDETQTILAYCCLATKEVAEKINGNLSLRGFIDQETCLFQLPSKKLQQRLQLLKGPQRRSSTASTTSTGV